MADLRELDLRDATKEIDSISGVQILHNEYTLSEWNYFFHLLKYNVSLERLDLWGNSLGEDRVFQLKASLTSNKKLKFLDLGMNKIDENGASFIGKALLMNSSLKILRLEDNLFGANGAKELSEGLKGNISLTELYLRGNQIGSIGAQAIAEALKVNKTLEELYISVNQISDSGVKALSESLKLNSSLKILNLGYNQISPSGASNIGDALKINTTLAYLNLEANQIGDKGLLHLNESVKINSTLESMNLEGNKINNIDLLDQLNHSLKKNQRIAMLDKKLKEETEKFNNEKEILEKNYNQKIQELTKEKESYDKNLRGFFKSIYNDLNDVRSELSDWKAQLYINDRIKKDSSYLNHAKDIVRKTIRVCNNYSTLNKMRKQLQTIIANVGEIESLEDFGIEVQHWIENFEKSLEVTNKLKIKWDKQVKMEDTLDVKQLELALGRNKKTISHEEEKNILNWIEEETYKINKLKIKCRTMFEQINEYGQRDMIIFNQDILSNSFQSAPWINKFQTFIRENGIFINRSIKDYFITSTHKSVNFATNLEGDKVALKIYELNYEYIAQQAWSEFSFLMKIQNRTYALPINGAFIESSANGINLLVEMSKYGFGSLLHWLKKEEQYSLDLYEEAYLRKKETKRDLSSILEVLFQIVEAVSDLHSIGLELQVLKPENILVDVEGNIKIIDFGINKVDEFTRMNFEGYKNYRYIPPERQQSMNSFSYKFGSWDVYSLGIIFYECLCDLNDIEIVDTLRGPSFSSSKILKQSGSMMSDEIYEIIQSMIHEDSFSRITIYQLVKKLKIFKIKQSLNINENIINQFQYQSSQSIYQLRSNIQSLNSNISSKLVTIDPNNFVPSFASIMNGITQQDEIGQTIQFAILGNKEMNCSFHKVIEIFFNNLFVIKNMTSNEVNINSSQYFEFIDGYFTPSDELEFKEEMEAFGRLIYHSIVKGYTLRMRLSPLIYCTFMNFKPKTFGLLNLYRRRDVQDVSSIERCKNDLDEVNKEMAKKSLKKLEEKFFGKGLRMKNIEHIRNGFTQFMNQEDINLLEQSQWDDIEFLCCGLETISSNMILQCLKNSLSSPKWEENENTLKTLQFYKYWIQNQSSFGLRKLLQYCTGYCFIPLKFEQFIINSKPSTTGIRTSISFHHMSIDTSCNTQEEFNQMIRNAIFSMSQLTKKRR